MDAGEPAPLSWPPLVGRNKRGAGGGAAPPKKVATTGRCSTERRGRLRRRGAEEAAAGRSSSEGIRRHLGCAGQRLRVNTIVAKSCGDWNITSVPLLPEMTIVREVLEGHLKLLRALESAVEVEADLQLRAAECMPVLDLDLDDAAVHVDVREVVAVRGAPRCTAVDANGLPRLVLLVDDPIAPGTTPQPQQLFPRTLNCTFIRPSAQL